MSDLTPDPELLAWLETQPCAAAELQTVEVKFVTDSKCRAHMQLSVPALGQTVSLFFTDFISVFDVIFQWWRAFADERLPSACYVINPGDDSHEIVAQRGASRLEREDSLLLSVVLHRNDFDSEPDPMLVMRIVTLRRPFVHASIAALVAWLKENTRLPEPFDDNWLNCARGYSAFAREQVAKVRNALYVVRVVPPPPPAWPPLPSLAQAPNPDPPPLPSPALAPAVPRVRAVKRPPSPLAPDFVVYQRILDPAAVIYSAEIQFSPPSAGWVRFHLFDAGGRFHQVFNLSYIGSPFHDLVKWWQDIAGGRFPATCEIDEEGSSQYLVADALPGSDPDCPIRRAGFILEIYADRYRTEFGETERVLQLRVRLERADFLKTCVMRFERWLREDFRKREWKRCAPAGYGIRAHGPNHIDLAGLKSAIAAILFYKAAELPKWETTRPRRQYALEGAWKGEFPLTFTVLMEPEHLVTFTDKTTLKRGEKLASEGKVLEMVYDNEGLTAVVQGSRPEPYDLWLSFDHREQRLTWQCSCPMGETGEFCKHLVAVARRYTRGRSALRWTGEEPTQYRKPRPPR